MKVEYGPPGAVGVKQLAYMGESEGAATGLILPVAAIAFGVLGFAWLTKNKGLQKQSGVVALVALLIGRPSS